jgi:N-acetylglucosaminyldiphosphoundecaprenol N-acetyl-beta-D-mannosaminyltransferase
MERVGTVRFDGCFLSRISRSELLGLIEEWIACGGQPRTITAMNVGKLARMQKDAKLAESVLGSAVVTADGFPVYLAARLVGKPLPERITGVDLMGDLLRIAGRKGYRVYFLGGRPPVLQEVLRRCREDHPGIKIVGSRDGYFGPDQEESVVRDIAAAAPDILLLGLGLPKKEYFIVDHGRRLQASVILPVGGGFDVYAGTKKRAPRWMQQLGVEWLWRSAYDRSRAVLVMKSALPFLVILAKEMGRQRFYQRRRS